MKTITACTVISKKPTICKRKTQSEYFFSFTNQFISRTTNEIHFLLMHMHHFNSLNIFGNAHRTPLVKYNPLLFPSSILRAMHQTLAYLETISKRPCRCRPCG